MAYDDSGTEKEVRSLLSRYPAPRRSRAKGADGGIYTAEMGPPPQDIDMGSSPPPKTVKKVKGGSVTRADGCCQRGKTRGKFV